ncbi:response regulator [Paenibacillus psychroresistens]|uniref:Response regulator n=1 Tax=Paenibacillus psychroresistens TaxID=1778678 RepID=A0A6B8RMA9_9BACL|nr:helix-turn-helix domain-containing protein [Paenibacillus psychroresistens]QGQ97159.1 response regulator [Paenibacillus psychroresistens]
MYKLLIVDDEMFAVEGIEVGVDWLKLDFTEIHKAYNAAQAKKIMLGNRIDIIICDIEMPGENGIEFMEWVKERFPGIEAIFLTCHADFKYAQRAIQLGSFEYLLKPVEFEVLGKTVEKALGKLIIERKTKQLIDDNLQYFDLWKTKKPVLFERFWQDLFWQRIIPTTNHIESALASNLMPLSIHSKVLLIMLSIEQWGKKLNSRDEEIMEYALRNAAAEMILGELPGQVLQDRNGVHFVLLYADDSHKPTVTFEQIKKNSKSYIDACSKYLFCSISCYIGEWVSLHTVWQSYNILLQMEHNNVTLSKSILFSKEQPGTQQALQLPALFEWSELMELGKTDELDRLAINMFGQLRKESNVRSETLSTLYHALLQTIYYVLHKRSISVQAIFANGEALDQALAIRSLDQLQDWTKRIFRMVTEHLIAVERGSTVVDKVKYYIAEHIFDEISRDDLAVCVHINSSYLSRLFKKEAGVSLTDYIVQERMKHARDLLIHSDEMISNIAKSFHYTNFSHFSKMFRKYYGMNPQDYRKQFYKELPSKRN